MMKLTPKPSVLLFILGFALVQISLSQSLFAPTAPGIHDQSQGAEPFVGRFSDGYVTLELQESAGQYTGQLSVEGVSYSLTAQGDANCLLGTVATPKADYIVTIARSDGNLLLTADGQQMTLKRQTYASASTPGTPSSNPPPIAPRMKMPSPAPSQVPTPPPGLRRGNTPQPPQGPWQGTYTLTSYSLMDPAQRQQGTLSIQVTPLPGGTFNIVSTVNGQPLVDIVVNAAGIDTVTGEEQFPLPWNTGQTTLYGIPAQVNETNGGVQFVMQSAQGSVQAFYDMSGVLMSFQGCEAG